MVMHNFRWIDTIASDETQTEDNVIQKSPINPQAVSPIFQPRLYAEMVSSDIPIADMNSSAKIKFIKIQLNGVRS